jgi:CTP:molybdopterin cytidylyltransferase MocA
VRVHGREEPRARGDVHRGLRFVRSRGLLLAAGAGTRYGGPKALAATRRDLVAAARRARARALRRRDRRAGARRRSGSPGCCRRPSTSSWRRLGPTGWAPRCGPAWPPSPSPSDVGRVVVSLVDLPTSPRLSCARVLAAGCRSRRPGAGVVRRGAGPPVLVGRDHWADVAAAAGGRPRSARPPAGADVTLVECGDLAPASTSTSRPEASPTASQRRAT